MHDLYMNWPKPPSHTKDEINAAGIKLISGITSTKEILSAYKIMAQFRAAHAYPINTFQATLRKKVEKEEFGENAFIAQRLKRSVTILEKLRQIPRLKLSNMQDIAGIRAVLKSNEDVYQLVNNYKESKRIQHDLVRLRDYILLPKEDGYRSIHLIYSYNNKSPKDWNGLQIELQIRTALQHSWATAVESVKNFLGRAIKTRTGQKRDSDWTDFFALVSTAFSYIEGSPIVSRFESLTKNEILEQIKALEKLLHVNDKLVAFPLAFQHIAKNSKKSHFCLIILNTQKKEIVTLPFGRDQIKEATREYEKAEKKYKEEEGVEPVLVSTSGESLQKAYAAFFGYTEDFRRNLEIVLSGEWI